MATIRQQIIELLLKQPMTDRDLSQALSIREKEVAENLPYIERSVQSKKKEFIIVPPECLTCGFSFKDGKKLKTPGRCPKCKSERIKRPVFFIK